MGHSQVEVIGKGKKPRVAFFPETAIYWIKQFLYYRSDDCPALFITTGNPRRWDRNDLSKYFKELKKQARIDKPVTPHILRHYASSRTMLPRRRPGAFCGLSGQTDVA
jgi:integrase/recombinase XerD